MTLKLKNLPSRRQCHLASLLIVLNCLVIAWPQPLCAQSVSTAKIRYEQVMGQALNQINAGWFAEAIRSLQSVETQYAGDPQFDFLLGLALLEDGQVNAAMFALQRVRLTDPNHGEARMALARAFYEGGQLEKAQAELNGLLDEQPPDLAREVITNYLKAIEHAARSRQFFQRYYVGTAFGHDSNANGGTDQNQFLGFLVNETSLETDSTIAQLSAGGTWSAALTDRLRWNTNLQLSHRFNFDADFIDSTTINFNSAMHSGRKNGRSSFGVNA
ncbi:MAG: tetratricopeptide repeat protein, partial [Gammaproteobacteria bacterium]|nr:tetratricopeptide repeat protein [Gammaproteobacteria bacterium]